MTPRDGVFLIQDQRVTTAQEGVPDWTLIHMQRQSADCFDPISVTQGALQLRRNRSHFHLFVELAKALMNDAVRQSF